MRSYVASLQIPEMKKEKENYSGSHPNSETKGTGMWGGGA